MLWFDIGCTPFRPPYNTKKFSRQHQHPLTAHSKFSHTMICSRCLYRARPQSLARAFSTTRARLEPPAPAATSTSAAQPFSTPLTPRPSDASLAVHLKPKPKPIAIPVSSCPAGTPLKGLNYIKGRDDPVALPEEEYPEWLWKCLEAKVKEGDEDAGEGDLFCTVSKTQSFYIRKLANKTQPSPKNSAAKPLNSSVSSKPHA